MKENDKVENGRESQHSNGGEGRQPPFRFGFLPVRDSLKPYLNSIYLFETSLPKIKEAMPAVGGQLFLVFQGTTIVSLDPEVQEVARSEFFVTPMSHAAQYELQGPVKAIGAALTQLGWAALTRIPADLEKDKMVDASTILGDEICQLREECGAGLDDGKISYEDAAKRLSDLIEPKFDAVSERHQQTIALTLEWLNSSVSPAVEDLYPLLPYSPRQAQRLVAKFFGLPPSKLVRRYRAQRAATLITHASNLPEAESELANAFTDQSHMIKEIAQFTGKTPKKLGDPAKSIVSSALDPKGYRPVKSMPGVFGEDDKDTQE